MSRRTQDTARVKDYFEYEAVTLFGLPSQVILLYSCRPTSQSYNPDV